MQPDGLTITPNDAAEPLEEERALVSAARQDPQAAGCLFDKYYSEIFRYLYHSTLNHAATEDLTSNVFFCAFRGLAFFQWRRIPFRAWLYRIATNELRMHYRRQTRARVRSAESDPMEPLSELPSADDQAAAADDYQLLHRALLKLGPKHRMIVVLRYFEGKSLSEICEITNKCEGTVKSRMHRGLAELKTALLRDGVTLP